MKVDVKEIEGRVVIDNSWGSVSESEGSRERTVNDKAQIGRSNNFQCFIAYGITDWQQLIEYFKIASREDLNAFNTKRWLITETMDRLIVNLWSLHFVKMYQNATLCFINMYNYMPSLKVHNTGEHMCVCRERERA